LALERLEDRTLLSSAAPGTDTIRAAYAQLPLAFEANQGQAAAPIDFLARGTGYTLALTPGDATLALQKPAGGPGDVVHLHLVGANPAALAVGRDELITKTNYYLTNDPSQWRSNIPNFGKVEYRSVYPGINLVYYGRQGQLEYDFVVAPGADPGVITLSIQGSQGVRLDGQGNLVLATAGGGLVEQAPVVYQDIGSVRQVVSGRFVLAGPNQVGFQVGAYDPSRPLVIDPTLSYWTYLTGGGQNFGQSIAVDSSGDAYVTGQAGPFGATSRYYAYVTEMNPTGTLQLYTTYLGGGGGDTGYGIAVDSAHNAYVSGITFGNFPTQSLNGFQPNYGGGNGDAFVAKLDASGSPVYSTYLGGSGADGPIGWYPPTHAIAVDGTGDAYVTGPTDSSDFPTTSGAAYPTWNSSWGGSSYIAEINPSLSGPASLVSSTYLPGGTSHAIALGASQVYVTGTTGSTSFPTTPNAYQKSFSGGSDAFVAVLNSASSQLVYSSYLGGSGEDHGSDIAVDGSGYAYVTGDASNGFPTTSGAYQTRSPFPSGLAAFVAKLNPNSSGSGSLVYSTNLGGSHGARGYGIAVDGYGNAYVTGEAGLKFPTTKDAIQSSAGNSNHPGFVTTFNATGSALLFSTYIGGTNGGDYTRGYGITLDASYNIYVTGTLSSRVQAFVAKISAVVSPPSSPSIPLNTSQQNPTNGRTSDTLLAALAGPYRLGLRYDTTWVMPTRDASHPDHPVLSWPALSPALWEWLAATNESTSERPLHPWTVQERVFGEFALPLPAAGDGHEMPWRI
jgi:hypothetical protein